MDPNAAMGEGILFPGVGGVNQDKDWARVVVVDDEANLAVLFAQYLARSFQVRCFCSPLEALRFLRHDRADLLLSDLMMPGMNGLDLVAQAKECLPNLRTIILSGVDPRCWATAPRELLPLVDAYLCKPISLRELRWQCLRVLGPGKVAREVAPLLAACPA